MDTFARLPLAERKVYFTETASRRRTRDTHIEKDFWVCWVLKRLLALNGIPALSFKGGTSLSKVFQLINRFSEDIDVSLDRAALGFSGDRDPANQSSKTKCKHLGKELTCAIAKMVKEQILPKMQEAFRPILGPTGWELKPFAGDDDDMTLVFNYPAACTYGKYVPPSIQIDFGRGDQWPSSRESLRPYVAETFPTAITEPVVTLAVLACERTFWGKVTLLHSENNRPKSSPVPPRMSRHWYDVAVMSTDSRFKDDKLDECLLSEVIAFKEVYFPRGWANYGAAVPGTLRMVPHQELEKILREDFRQMEEMFWGEPISFEEVLDRIQRLEARINARREPPATESSKGKEEYTL